jgi:hypothetical protein
MSKAKSAPLPDIAIIACHFNPCGYERPRLNLSAVIDHLTALGITLHLESCYFDEPQEGVKEPAGSHFSKSILWHKEALLNSAVARLPDHITKVVILDADVLIPDAKWLADTSALLDECQIIQPWARVAFLDKDGQEKACMASCGKGFARKDSRASDFNVYHPGFAWAAQRSLWTDGPGLYERCPVGSGDELLATAATGAELSDKGESAADRAAKNEWIAAFRKWNSGGNFGFLRADIKTLWHGEYKNRHYKSRHALLVDFDPATDLDEDGAPGPVEWSEYALREKPDMVRAVADYFGMRLEDGPLAPALPEPEPEPEVVKIAGACDVCGGVYSGCTCKLDAKRKP